MSTPCRATSCAVLLCNTPPAHCFLQKRQNIPSSTQISLYKTGILSAFNCPSHKPRKPILIWKLFYNTDSLSYSFCAGLVLLDEARRFDSCCVQDAGAPDIYVMGQSGFLFSSVLNLYWFPIFNCLSAHWTTLELMLSLKYYKSNPSSEMFRQYDTHKGRIAFFHMYYCKCISNKFCSFFFTDLSCYMCLRLSLNLSSLFHNT